VRHVKTLRRPQYLVFRTEYLLTAVSHHQHKIQVRQHSRLMGNDENDSAAPPNSPNSQRERRLALCVEVGIRLVKNHEEWVAIESACECYALLLASR
jgi:hypothetical protein